MAGGKNFVDGPAYVANAAADLYTPGTGTYALVRHIRLVNKDSSARTVAIYMGATGGSAGGTELVGTQSIAANDALDVYFPAGLKVTTSDFISGVASQASTVVATITGELYVA